MLTSIEYDDTLGFVLVSRSSDGLANRKRHKNRTQKMATEANNVEAVKEQQIAATQAKVDAINADRGTNKGTRLVVGQTRGKGSQVITFEKFDENKPELNPTSIAEFMTLAKIESNEAGEKVLVSYLIDGYNSQSYANASDPIAEYVEPTWTPDEQKGFKLVVKNFAAQLSMTVEDAVNVIKPQFVAGLAKKRG
jgi:hypothetical protein